VVGGPVADALLGMGHGEKTAYGATFVVGAVLGLAGLALYAVRFGVGTVPRNRAT